MNSLFSKSMKTIFLFFFFFIIINANFTEVLDTKDILIVPKYFHSNTQEESFKKITKRNISLYDNNSNHEKIKSIWKARYEIYFKKNSSYITYSQKKKLKRIRNKIKNQDKIYIYGFSSSIGAKRKNYRISRRRAKAVYRYLRRRHPKAKYNVTYYGEKYPRYSNKSRRGRNGNRRVVIKIK